MKYYFNTLRKMDFNSMETSQALALMKFNYITKRIEKKEYRYLIKKIFKILKMKGFKK